MEAKDTVMKPEEYNPIIEHYKAYPKTPSPSGRNELAESLIKSQAEITFPFGKQEGIKEVVDWVDKHSYKGKFFDTLMIENEEWQAFLKERLVK